MVRFAVVVLCLLPFHLGACGSGTAPPPGGFGPQPIVIATFQAATVVIGQADAVSDDGDAGMAGANAVGLDAPQGAVAGGSIFINDQNNSRILGFNAIPGASGTAADFVVGQPDFVSEGFGLAADEFDFPNGIASGAGRLFLADTDNNRVLIWNGLPAGNVPADVVVGQADFVSDGADAGANGLNGPQDVCAAGGRLFVADSLSNRVLIWNSIPAANNAAADVVVGQPDFIDVNSGLSSVRLNSPKAVWSDGVRLVVSDSGNNRVLIWNSIPTTNGAAANVVVGQVNFVSQVASSGAQGLEDPCGAVSDGTTLFIADSDNNRVLGFSPFPTANNPVATVVIGQSNFVNNARDDDDQDGVADATTSARTLDDPRGVAILENRLLVTDNRNNRVLVFQGQ